MFTKKDKQGHCKPHHGLKVRKIRFLSLDRLNQGLPDSPPHLPGYMIKMQRLQIEWEMSCHPLRGMAHMSAWIRDISQHRNFSSTHSPLISLTHTLSLEGRARRRKQVLEWESGKDEEEKIDQAYQGQQDQLWIKIKDLNHLISHGWLKEPSLPITLISIPKPYLKSPLLHGWMRRITWWEAIQG